MNQDNPLLSQSSQSSISKQNKRSNFQFTYDSENYLLSLIQKYKEDIFTRGNRIKTWETVLSEFNDKYKAKIIQSRTINHRFQMLRKNLENKLMHENQPVQQLSLNENEKLLIDVMDYMYKNNYASTDPFSLSTSDTAGFSATRPSVESHGLDHSERGTVATSYKTGGRSGYTTGTSISSVSSSMITPSHQGSHDASEYSSAELLANNPHSVENQSLIGTGSLSYSNRVNQARDPYVLLHDAAATHQLQQNLYRQQQLFTQEQPLNLPTHQINEAADDIHTGQSSVMFDSLQHNVHQSLHQQPSLHSDSIGSNSSFPQQNLFSQSVEESSEFKTPYFKATSTNNPSSAAFPQQSSNQPRVRARHMSIATPQFEHTTYEQSPYPAQQNFQQPTPQEKLQSQSYEVNESQTQFHSLVQSQQLRMLMQQQVQTQNATQVILKQILALQAQYKSEISSIKEEIKNLREETTEKIDRILTHLDHKVLLNEPGTTTSGLSNQLLENRTINHDLSLNQQQQQQRQNQVQTNPQASSSDEDMLFERPQH